MDDTANRPLFPTYLLPSFSFPTFRRRKPSSSNILTETSVPSLSTSPQSSANTTPSSTPPTSNFLTTHFRAVKELLQHHQDAPEPQIASYEPRLSRTQPDVLRCITCSTDIAFTSQIVSKGFTGRHGRAYLVSPPPSSASSKTKSKPTDLINTKVGKAANRQLLTGAHVVADVACVICQSVLGWKYVDAKDAGQRYKIGKFILETKRVVCYQSWEDTFLAEGDTDREGASANVTERVKGDEGENENNGDGEDDVVVFDSEDEDECEDLFAGIWDAEVVAKRRSRRVASWRKVEEAF